MTHLDFDTPSPAAREPESRAAADEPISRGESGSRGASRRAPAPRSARRSALREGAPTSLDLYVRSIARIRVLDREETYTLARQMEAAESEFRAALFSISGTGVELLGRWRARRALGLVTAALSTHYRDGSGEDWGAVIDAAFSQLEAPIEERLALASTKGARAQRRRAQLDAEVAERLSGADLSLFLLLEIALRFR